jgi:hypothetical protein
MTIAEAKELLDNLIGMISDNQESDYDTALKMGIKALDQEPKEGHWVLSYDGIYWYGCSDCGIKRAYKTNYCPDCGARMVGGAE